LRSCRLYSFWSGIIYRYVSFEVAKDLCIVVKKCELVPPGATVRAIFFVAVVTKDFSTDSFIENITNRSFVSFFHHDHRLD